MIDATFSYIVRLEEEFIIRLCRDRTLLVPRSRGVLLEDFVSTIRLPIRFEA
jgi:hypothetical protein